MPTFAAQKLVTLGQSIFAAAGAPDDIAKLVAESLVRANLVGHDSHGIMRTLLYVQQIRNGQLFPTARPQTMRREAAIAVVDGMWGFGQLAADYATRQVLDLAHTYGVGCAALVNANHAGRLGGYAEVMAADNYIGMIMTSGGAPNSNVAPYGGREGIFGTNPVAWGVPRSAPNPPIVVDYATSSVAAGKLDVAISKGETIQPGMLLDAEGRPTTDPAAYLNGGVMLPFGGHKGYGLLLLVEIMGRLLTGGIIDSAADYVRERGSWTIITAWRVGAFVPEDQFLTQIDALAERIKSSQPAEGLTEVKLPGDPELQTFAERSRSGVSVPESTWDALLQLAGELSVDTGDIVAESD